MKIRSLQPSEWRSFRDFRLHALQSSPGLFLTSHAQAAARTEEDWRTLLAPERQQIFGLFDDDRLIGITAVFTSGEDLTTATLAMSFIDPVYRERNLSRLFFAARLDWIKARNFRRVVVSHRASNTTAMRAIRAGGFQPVGRRSHTWPDGTTEDEISYELKLVEGSQDR
jgi:GNAT superfamily N-acetyltransferase